MIARRRSAYRRGFEKLKANLPKTRLCRQFGLFPSCYAWATMPEQDSVKCECQDHEPSTFDRPELFVPLIGVMFAGVFFLFALADLRYGMQFGSLIPYTTLVVLATFSAQRGQQPYFFECPIVHRNLHRLARRHGGFLVALVVLETVALQLRPHLPASWLIAGKDGSPFNITLFILCLCLAFAQILSNRSLLGRAHRESNMPS
jgi:hypothetical protein